MNAVGIAIPKHSCMNVGTAIQYWNIFPVGIAIRVKVRNTATVRVQTLAKKETMIHSAGDLNYA